MTIAAGQKIKATDLGVWQSYTPTLTNLTATATAEYTKIGNTVICHVHLAMTGAGAGAVTKVSLPVMASSTVWSMFTGMLGHFYDVSASKDYIADMQIGSGGTDVSFWAVDTAGAATSAWFGNAPIALTTGDTLDFTLIYKAA